MSGYDRLEGVEAPLHRKLPATEIGYNAPRNCTDKILLFIFGVIWILMIVVAASAVEHGDLDRLIDGVDYLGNMCGHGTPNAGYDSAIPWSSRTVLFFPVAFDPIKVVFNSEQALKFGMCLPSCPQKGQSGLDFYGPVAPALASYVMMFNSSSKFNRCVPNFASFDCAGNPQCMQATNSSSSTFDKELNLQSTALRSFAEVRAHWWVILLCSIICILISFGWLFILRVVVRPMVIVTMVLGFIVLCVLGYIFYYRHTQAQKDAPSSSSEQWYLAFAVLTWIAAFLYLCVGIYIYRDVTIACDIIEEASKIPLEMPSMLAVPPLTVLLIIPTAIFSVFMMAEIYTSSYLAKEANSIPVLNGGSPSPVPSSAANTTTTSQYVGENWRVYAYIFNVFVFLWTVGFIHAIGFMTISFGAVFWYWSARGDVKSTEHGILDGARLTFRYHLGSLAFGSLIIAIIQTVRILILCVEKHMRRYVEKSDTVKFLFCCFNCCLAYFDRFVQFVNKNAYVVQCMTGEPFLSAAKHAMQLLIRNALSVGAVNFVGEYVMIIGKLLITAVTVLIAYAIMTKVEDEDSAMSGFILILVVVGIVAYFISSVFVNVFGVCIDTVLLSYCYDLEQNNGRDKPYFFPDSLGHHVERASRRAKETEIRRQMDAVQ